jgi:hypothetical protein
MVLTMEKFLLSVCVLSEVKPLSRTDMLQWKNKRGLTDCKFQTAIGSSLLLVLPGEIFGVM